MQIGLFTDTFNQVNGVAAHVKLLAAELAKKHDVTVYAGSGAAKNYKVKNLLRIPFPFERNYEIIIPHIMRPKIDVAHCHTPYFAGWIGLLSGKPTVTTTHTSPAQMFSLFGLHGNFAWKYIIYFHNRSDHVICQTKSTAELFKKHGMKRPYSIISAAIDFEKFSNGNARRFRDKYGVNEFVLSAMRLTPEKRPDWTAAACAELDIPAVFTSHGPLREKLEKINPKAIFLQDIPDQDMPDAFAAAAVFVFPSASETEGLVVAEAMAAGTPVVAANIPCISEFVNGKNGITVRTYAEFREKLKELWENKNLRAQISREGKKSAAEKDIKICAKKIVEVYESMLS